MLTCQVLIIVVLSLIFVQDIASRSVYWIAFPALAVLFLAASWFRGLGVWEVGEMVSINFGFLLLQYLLTSLWFLVKSRRWVNIAAELLGWGDILLLIDMTFCFSVLNFFLFYIGSLAIILTGWTVWQWIIQKKQEQIPLAGLQSLFLIVLLSGHWWFGFVDVTNDAWLLNLITK